MKALLATILLPFLLSAAPLVGQDQTPIGERAFVELAAPDGRVFVGAAVDVTVRVGLDQRLVREQLIQLFRRELDVAIRLDTPWAKPVDGFAHQGAPPGFSAEVSSVIDGAVRELRRGAVVQRGERRFAVFEIVTRFVPTRAGELRIPPAVLHFAWATAFEEDFLGERVPRGRQDAHLEAEGLTLTVEDLPTEGRPEQFQPLVGRFTARAALADDKAPRVGENLTLRIVLRSDDDLTPFAPPPLAGLGDFHVRGLREEREPGRRIVVYDLIALRAGTQRIPPVEIPYFDPGPPPRYRSTSTDAVLVTVAAAADGTTAIDRHGNPVVMDAPEKVDRGSPGETAPTATDPVDHTPIPGVDVLFGLLPVAIGDPDGKREDFLSPPPTSKSVLTIGLCLPWLFAIGLWFFRKRAGSWEHRARRRRRRRARPAFRRAMHEPHRDRGAALAEFVAAWLDCDRAAVIDAALPSHLREAGLATDLSSEIDHCLDALARARFGSVEAPPDDAVLLDLVSRTDDQFRGRLPDEHPGRGHPPARVALGGTT